MCVCVFDTNSPVVSVLLNGRWIAFRSFSVNSWYRKITSIKWNALLIICCSEKAWMLSIENGDRVVFLPASFCYFQYSLLFGSCVVFLCKVNRREINAFDSEEITHNSHWNDPVIEATREQRNIFNRRVSLDEWWMLGDGEWVDGQRWMLAY